MIRSFHRGFLNYMLHHFYKIVAGSGKNGMGPSSFTIFQVPAASCRCFPTKVFKKKPKIIQNLQIAYFHKGITDNQSQKLGPSSQKNVEDFKKRKEILTDDTESAESHRKTLMEKDNMWTIPNLFCVIRIRSAPVLAYMIVNSQFGPAIGLFAIAGVTDLLDGWIARIFPSQSSIMGSFLDPMADKILVGTLFLSLTYINLIPVPLTCLIVARDVILLAAGFYIRYKSLEPPITFTRYFDVTHATAQLAPTLLSKVNTGIQLGLIGSTLLSTVVPYDMTMFLSGLWTVTACTTVGSAVNYLLVKDTVKFLRKKSQAKKE